MPSWRSSATSRAPKGKVKRPWAPSVEFPVSRAPLSSATPDVSGPCRSAGHDADLERGRAHDDLYRVLEPRCCATIKLPVVAVIDELLANNHIRARGLADQHLDVRPTRRLAVVTCMDSRLDVFTALGLRDGEAHVLRNAGGVITDDVIRSLAISQRRLGTREIMLIHHTDCGMQKITDDGFRAELQRATGVAPAFAIESFTDLDADVRQSMLRVQRSPFLAHRDDVRGFVYDVDTHRLREIQPAAGDGVEPDA